jgi:hypothetical protein
LTNCIDKMYQLCPPIPHSCAHTDKTKTKNPSLNTYRIFLKKRSVSLFGFTVQS